MHDGADPAHQVGRRCLVERVASAPFMFGSDLLSGGENRAILLAQSRGEDWGETGVGGGDQYRFRGRLHAVGREYGGRAGESQAGSLQKSAAFHGSGRVLFPCVMFVGPRDGIPGVTSDSVYRFSTDEPRSTS